MDVAWWAMVTPAAPAKFLQEGRLWASHTRGMERDGLPLRLASAWRVWTLTVVVSAGIAASVFVRAVRRPSLRTYEVAGSIASGPIDVERRAIGPVVPVELERRWLALGGLASPDAIDEALGGPVPAWEPFLYTRDAQPRLAVAGEVYASNGPQPIHELVRDRDGGIWHIRRTPVAPHPVSARRLPVTYSRDIYVLPTGSAFRGELDADLRPVTR